MPRVVRGQDSRAEGKGNESGAGRSAGRVVLTVAAPGVAAPLTARLVEVCLRFGLSLAEGERVIVSGLALDLRPGSVTLIVGPSGAGKTLLIREIARRAPLSQVVGDIDMPADVPVLDAVAPTRPINEAIGLLTACGLGEPWLWMRSFDVLSHGERFRARLARAVSLWRRNGGGGVLLCDEFGSLLHERLARAVAFNLRKLATRGRLAVVVATSREEIEQDLRPDCVIRLSRQSGFVHACRERDADGAGARLSFADDLQVVRGTLRDYEAFAAMHYRHRQQVGFVSAVFVMRDRKTGEALGVVVYGHPSLELALRNKVTGGRYVRQAKLLNQEVRVLKRLIIHPDVRGCGLGHELVRKTLPLAGARFVECLAVMGAVNPVFEKAGMRRVGVCCGSAGSEAALAWLRAAGADPLEAAFTSHVRCRPAVRRVVAHEVANWYRATTGGGEQRVGRQTPTVLAQTYRQLAGSQPVYFIWAAANEDREFIEANLRDAEEAAQAARGERRCRTEGINPSARQGSRPQALLQKMRGGE